MQLATAAVERFLKAGIPDGKAHVSLRDGHGLVLRQMRAGKPAWYFVFRLPGEGRARHQRTLTLGQWPDVDVGLAKRRAAAARNKVLSGIDPLAEKREAARQEKTRLSVALDDYEKWLISRRLVKTVDMMSGLRRGFKPLLRKTLDEITLKDMVEAIERIERDGRPGAAADFRKLASAFLRRQVVSGTIRISPLFGYRRAKPARDEVAEAELAGKALTHDEIKAVWEAAGELGTFGKLVRMGLLSGLRRGELANLRWSWVDRQAGIITIPGRNTKTGAEHVVVVSRLMGHLLDEIHHRGSDLLFPGRHLAARRPMSGWSKLLVKLREVSGVEGVAMHDLRRAFRTALSDLDVPESVAEIMIGHRRPDLIRRYARSKLIEQRRRAAATYDAWLAAQLGLDADDSDNVERLPRR